MSCRRILSAAVVLVALASLPRVARAQSMDKSAKPAMKDTSAMQHDGSMHQGGMSPGAMAKDKDMSKDAAKETMGHEGMAKPAMAEDKAAPKGKSDAGMAKGKAMPRSHKGAMADSAKMSHP